MKLSAFAVAPVLTLAIAGAASASTMARPVRPGDMNAACRSDVAGLTATTRTHVKTGKVVKAKDGAYTVRATADLGAQGKKPFECDFDAAGNFLHAKSLVDEGKL